MPLLSPQEIMGVIPGESMTKERGILPFDKPAQTSSPEAGVQLVFDAITEPKSARKLISTLQKGVPVNLMVDSLMMMLHGEGIVSPQALPVMAPAIASMIEGMADLAGVTPVKSEEPDPWTTPDEDEVEALVGKFTGKIAELAPPEEEEPQQSPQADEPAEAAGLMTPPSKEGIL